MKRALVFTAAVLASSGQIVETPVPGDPVGIESGLVAGKVLPSRVKAYLGIPFAAPPVRELRWREPQRVKSWKGVYNADRKMPECIQVLRPHNLNHYFGEEASSEDCLYLNVWAPSSAKMGSNLPVIVFIYGGGSTIGSSGMAIYAGETGAERSVYLKLGPPSSAKMGSTLPVIVFIYGGGSTIGSSGMAIYAGETVAER